MRVYTKEDKKKVILGFSHVDPRHNESFQASSYEQKDDRWVKEFPMDHPEIQQVIKNHQQQGITMVKQHLGELPVPWERALKAFCQRTEGQDLDWWLTGSGAAAARGVPLEPHDLDIMVPSTQSEKLRSLFRQEWMEPYQFTEDWVVAYFGVLFLHCRIDIASDPHDWVDDPEPCDFGLHAQSNFETIEWQGFQIKVPPLELQSKVNRRRGRIERAEQIDAFLKNSSIQA